MFVNVVIEFCLLLKFNVVYKVLDEVISDIKKGFFGDVFFYLKDVYYKGVENFGWGVEY